jgi:UMF1 family MFS transporter
VNISNKKTVGRISGLGIAVGYLGTVFSVLVAYYIGSVYGYETLFGIKLIFILTAALYFLIALVGFYYLKELSAVKITKEHFKTALHRVISTLKSIKKFKHLWLFLLASFLYVDGANTAIIFLYLYARDQLGLSLAQFFPLYIAMAITASIGALIFGKLTDKFGHKRTLVFVLFLWTIIILMLYLKTNYTTFIITGLAGGALLGAIWTITRPLLLELAPKANVAELLGYQGLTEKFSGVLGPFFFGLVSVTFGFRPALLIVIALFLAGATVLRFVKTGGAR